MDGQAALLFKLTEVKKGLTARGLLLNVFNKSFSKIFPYATCRLYGYCLFVPVTFNIDNKSYEWRLFSVPCDTEYVMELILEGDNKLINWKISYYSLLIWGGC